MERKKVHNFSKIRNLLIMKNKKKRSENFNKSEVYLLVDILEKYKIVVENKKLNAAAWADKKTAWENITREFNAISGNPPRTWKTLKLKYEGIKKEIKRKYCLIKQHPSKVGNDRVRTEFLSSYEEKVLSMMQPRITGLQSGHDIQETEQQPLMLKDCDEPITYDDIKIEDLGDVEEHAFLNCSKEEQILSAIIADDTVPKPLKSKECDDLIRICKAEALEEDEHANTDSKTLDDTNAPIPIPSARVSYTSLPQRRHRSTTFRKHFNMNASMGTSTMEDVPMQKLMTLKRRVLLLQGTLLKDEIESKRQSRKLEREIVETNLETARVELKIKQKILEQMG